MMSFQVHPIGLVKTDWRRDGPRIHRDEIVSRLVIEEKYAEALEGIEEYSHLFVLFWFHQLRPPESYGLRMHAKRGREGPFVGILATRGYGRPNPIGLAVVELLRREANVLTVRGLDAFDGTPILDIKPYDHLDQKQAIRVPEWSAHPEEPSA